ncbi:MAG: succinate dehydrogenase, cytochrome b556 subunit [Proteobacteria bacterium]|nr:succinate dehydrogenase, cytochrome b556 subunit [Pseudomonadota bacterium]
MATPSRPLSPHLQVYRWRATMLSSILNRMTGLILTAAFALLCIWLMAVASGSESYACVARLLRGPLGVLLLLGVGASLSFHLLTGVRHLLWDAGLGFDKSTARRTSWLVFAGTVILTLGLLVWVLA